MLYREDGPVHMEQVEKWQLLEKLAPPQETHESVLNLGLYREISLREGHCYGDRRHS